MELDWNQIVARGKSGIGVSEAEALAITELRETDELIALLEAAEAVRFHHKGNKVNTCGITNAKSGRCPEKCNFCSQSAHFSTEAPKFTTKAADTIVAEAEAAEATRLTSGAAASAAAKGVAAGLSSKDRAKLPGWAQPSPEPV